jgi:hypothetical protein
MSFLPENSSIEVIADLVADGHHDVAHFIDWSIITEGVGRSTLVTDARVLVTVRPPELLGSDPAENVLES